MTMNATEQPIARPPIPTSPIKLSISSINYTVVFLSLPDIIYSSSLAQSLPKCFKKLISFFRYELDATLKEFYLIEIF